MKHKAAALLIAATCLAVANAYALTSGDGATPARPREVARSPTLAFAGLTATGPHSVPVAAREALDRAVVSEVVQVAPHDRVQAILVAELSPSALCHRPGRMAHLRVHRRVETVCRRGREPAPRAGGAPFTP